MPVSLGKLANRGALQEGIVLVMPALVFVAFVAGLTSGTIIAHAAVQTMFAARVMGTVAYGFGRFLVTPRDAADITEAVGSLRLIGSSMTLGIPNVASSLPFVVNAVGLFLLFRFNDRYGNALGTDPAATKLKVEIDCVVGQAPRVIIFGEPVRGVDFGAISRTHGLIGKLARRGGNLASGHTPEDSMPRTRSWSFKMAESSQTSPPKNDPRKRSSMGRFKGQPYHGMREPLMAYVK